LVTGSRIQTIYDDLAVLRKGWVVSGWSWDTRLSCACSSFGADLAGQARAVVASAFAHTIDARSLRRASPLVQEIAEQTGGVRSEQLVFATEPVADTLAYGLWWPWNDEVTISMRVGLTGLWAEREVLNLQSVFRIASD
jgi:hypothetical protein